MERRQTGKSILLWLLERGNKNEWKTNTKTENSQQRNELRNRKCTQSTEHTHRHTKLTLKKYSKFLECLFFLLLRVANERLQYMQIQCRSFAKRCFFYSLCTMFDSIFATSSWMHSYLNFFFFFSFLSISLRCFRFHSRFFAILGFAFSYFSASSFTSKRKKSWFCCCCCCFNLSSGVRFFVVVYTVHFVLLNVMCMYRNFKHIWI